MMWRKIGKELDSLFSWNARPGVGTWEFYRCPTPKLYKAPRPRLLQPPWCKPPSRRFRIWPPGRFSGGGVGDLSAFGKDPNRFQAKPCLLYLIVPLTHVQLFCMSQAATRKGTTEMQRSGIFAKQLFSTLHDTSDDEAPMTYSMKL